MATTTPNGLQPNITKQILVNTANLRVKTQRLIIKPSNRSLKRNGNVFTILTLYFLPDLRDCMKTFLTHPKSLS
jgi:hypothetical protein